MDINYIREIINISTLINITPYPSVILRAHYEFVPNSSFVVCVCSRVVLDNGCKF